MSAIIDFYRGEGTDAKGRTWSDIMQFDQMNLERVHDYIQWLFPLPEVSRAQPQSPVATATDYEVMGQSNQIQMRLGQTTYKMLRFYLHSSDWKRAKDHNHLRITRIIRCLILAGNPLAANAFHDTIMIIAPRGHTIPPATSQYWTMALNKNPYWLGTDHPNLGAFDHINVPEKD